MTRFLDAARATKIKGESGKQAVKAEYHAQIMVKGDSKFTGSIDLDAHFVGVEPKANRWDYGVGFHAGHEFVLWIEPHPASGSGDVAEMIKKLDWLQSKLQTPGFKGFADLTRETEARNEIPYRWLYKGKTSFRAGEKAAKQLAKKGFEVARAKNSGGIRTVFLVIKHPRQWFERPWASL